MKDLFLFEILLRCGQGLKDDEVGEGSRKTRLRYIKDPDEYIAEQVRRSGSAVEGRMARHSPLSSGKQT